MKEKSIMFIPPYMGNKIKGLKIFISFMAMLLITSLNNISAQDIPFIELNVKNVAIIKSNYANRRTAPTVNISTTPKALVSAFGKPKSIKKIYAETDDTTMTVYQYNGAKFYYLGDHLDSFDLSNSNFCVITNTSANSKTPDKYQFKVGDPITKIKTSYPSFKTKPTDSMFFLYYMMEKKYDQHTGKYRSKKQLLDAGLSFTQKGAVITGIHG